jgi:hypothetical protein
MSHNKKFDEKCKFRYDEFRTGDTKKGGGEHALFGRCLLKKTNNRKCMFPSFTHFNCPLSDVKKHKAKEGTVRFKGKWKKKVSKNG